MSIQDLPERLLQRAVHMALTDVACTWTCTNGEVVQVVAAGLPNVHAGPDFQDMAVLHNGIVYVGDGEFHRKTSDWFQHSHSGSYRYQDLLMHLVLEDDDPSATVARFTLVMPSNTVRQVLGRWTVSKPPASVELEELQHFALLRLLRLTADAQALVTKLGPHEALRTMAGAWFTRLSAKLHRPTSANHVVDIRNEIATSKLGLLCIHFQEVPAAEVLHALDHAVASKISNEGSGIRRELLVNVVLPMLCARASHDQRVVLLHWYWGAKAVHSYGVLHRKFINQPQNLVWEQQGMLEYMRHHGRRISTCGEAIRAYGVAGTLEFLRAAH